MRSSGTEQVVVVLEIAYHLNHDPLRVGLRESAALILASESSL